MIKGKTYRAKQFISVEHLETPSYKIAISPDDVFEVRASMSEKKYADKTDVMGTLKRGFVILYKNNLWFLDEKDVPNTRQVYEVGAATKFNIGDSVMITDSSSLKKGLSGIITGVDGNFWVVKTVRGTGLVSKNGVAPITNF